MGKWAVPVATAPLQPGYRYQSAYAVRPATRPHYQGASGTYF